MASVRVRWRTPRLRWLGQDEPEEEPMQPPLIVTAVRQGDGKWSPGEKIMLGMLAVNAVWFGWTVVHT